jgi:hypothetical protein
MMAKTIEGVPPSISRQAYIQVIELLGFEADKIQLLEFRMDGIYATVADKPARIDFLDNSVYKHRVFIPVDDTAEQPITEDTTTLAELGERIERATRESVRRAMGKD